MTPLTIKQLSAATIDNDIFIVDGKRLHLVSIMGFVVQRTVNVPEKCETLTVIDGSGRINCINYVDTDIDNGYEMTK